MLPAPISAKLLKPATNINNMAILTRCFISNSCIVYKFPENKKMNETMQNQANIKVVWQALSRVLQEAGMDTPVADARLLMQKALGITREDMLMHSDRPVVLAEQAEIEILMQRRLKHEPVSRILGKRAFWKSEFKITQDTLDPRPDSETLIVLAAHHVQDAKRILDLGTGTGCLLLSLLQEWPQASGVGVDVNPGAVLVARENAEALNLSTRASFVAASWEDYKTGEEFDVIISNPPYIGESERGDLAPEVALYDPAEALFAGEDGLSAYRSLVKTVPGLLKKGGWFFVEIGYNQANSVKSILAEGGFDVIEIRRDLAGNDRVIVTKKP